MPRSRSSTVRLPKGEVRERGEPGPVQPELALDDQRTRPRPKGACCFHCLAWQWPGSIASIATIGRCSVREGQPFQYGTDYCWRWHSDRRCAKCAGDVLDAVCLHCGAKE